MSLIWGGCKGTEEGAVDSSEKGSKRPALRGALGCNGCCMFEGAGGGGGASLIKAGDGLEVVARVFFTPACVFSICQVEKLLITSPSKAAMMCARLSMSAECLVVYASLNWSSKLQFHFTHLGASTLRETSVPRLTKNPACKL